MSIRFASLFLKGGDEEAMAKIMTWAMNPTTKNIIAWFRLYRIEELSIPAATRKKKLWKHKSFFVVSFFLVSLALNTAQLKFGCSGNYGRVGLAGFLEQMMSKEGEEFLNIRFPFLQMHPVERISRCVSIILNQIWNEHEWGIVAWCVLTKSSHSRFLFLVSRIYLREIFMFRLVFSRPMVFQDAFNRR